MPEIETQVYWHDAELDGQAPWSSDAELQETIQRSRHIRQLRISPMSFHVQLSAPERRRELTAQRRADSGTDRGVHIEPTMTLFGVVNGLLQHLRRPCLTVAEAQRMASEITAEYEREEAEAQTASTSQRPAQGAQGTTANGSGEPPTVVAAAAAPFVDGKGTVAGAGSGVKVREVKEAPLLQLLEKIAASRDLAVKALTKKELRQRRMRISAQDLVRHRKVAVVVDRQKPTMAAAIIDGKRSAAAVKESLHVLVPSGEPQPWRRRVHTVHSIDRFECILAFMYDPALDDEEGGEAGAVQRRPRSTTSMQNTNSSRGSSVFSRDTDADSDGEVETVLPLIQPRTGRLQTLFAESSEPIGLWFHGRGAVGSHHDSVGGGRGIPCPRRRCEGSAVALLPHPVRPSDDLTEDRAAFFLSQEDETVVPASTKSRNVRDWVDTSVIAPAGLWCNSSTYRSSDSDGSVAHHVETVDDDLFGAGRPPPQWEASSIARWGCAVAPIQFSSGKAALPQTRIVFPKQAKDVELLFREVGVDPFLTLPTISLPSKHSAAKHVKHTWTQRLVERARRPLLYMGHTAGGEFF